MVGRRQMPADGDIAAALPGMLMQRGDAKIEVQGCEWACHENVKTDRQDPVFLPVQNAEGSS
jgi:hypothetical protein